MNVVTYDASASDFLQFSWALGAQLFAARRKVDLVVPVKTWREVFDLELERTCTTLQVWGHGVAGAPLIAGKAPDVATLAPFLRSAMRDDKAHVWFRSCNVAAGVEGRRWCGALADLAGVRVAAHTFVIHALQSGLRVAIPGERPSWSTTEGIAPDGSLIWSNIRAPRTVTCLATSIPKGLAQ